MRDTALLEGAGARHGMAEAQHAHGKVCVHRPLECKNVTARPINTGFEILPAHLQGCQKFYCLYSYSLL